MNTPLRQINLFADIANAYTEAPGGVLDNASLYAVVAEGMGTTKEALDTRIPIGRAGVPRSTIKRKIRWYQHNREFVSIDTQPFVDITWTLVIGSSDLLTLRDGEQ